MRKPNSIIVLLYIFHIIHPQKQKRSVQPFCFWGEYSKGLSNPGRRWTWHDKCNICSRYCIYHVKFTSYCELIECSRLIRIFIVSLMYNNYTWIQWKAFEQITSWDSFRGLEHTLNIVNPCLRFRGTRVAHQTLFLTARVSVIDPDNALC